MPDPIVECIPNFSEARRPEVIAEIIKAVQSVPGVLILDRHSDLDHNRTVLTFVGPPTSVEEAAFLSISKAAELIDLDQHSGEHPRVGAADVVPFVPISNIDMRNCVEIANRLGKRVGEELNIPVYLYEEAATKPENKNLENIRKGQYEALKEEILTNPDRQPDFGPNQLGTAGATVIGARNPLIAFNVYLTTDDVSIAQKISRAVRNSSGGLRYVKAMGVLVDGQAQVSMNLTNFRKTPVARVVELIRSEAQRYGTNIHHSELVGLIPQDALTDTAIWHLRLDDFSPDQILETRLYSYMLSDGKDDETSPTTTFLDDLAKGEPVPGGGSAAAYCCASAAALVSMVARLTVGKRRYEDVEEKMKTILSQSEELRTRMTTAVQRDANAFIDFMNVLKLPKETEQEQAIRKNALQEASIHAAEIPLEVACSALEILKLATEVVRLGNKNAITDAATAGVLARASLSGAGMNVRINLMGMDSEPRAHTMLETLKTTEESALDFESQLKETLKERGNLPLH